MLDLAHQPFAEPAFWLRVFMAILCGAALGLEREVHEKPAGLRTTMLICLGAALYAMCGELLQPGEGMPLDRGRIPAQVVAGIGFLGAGVILHYGGTVRGLTTAALIWVSAAIGVVIGIGYPLTGLGLTGTVIVALVALGWIEKNYVERAVKHKKKNGQ